MAVLLPKSTNPNARKPYTVRWTDAARKQHEKSFVTRREATDWKVKVEHDQRSQIFTDPMLGNILFREYAETWLRQHTGAPSSIKAYRGSLDNHVLPALGDTQLRKITRDQVRELLLETMPAKPVGQPVVATARLVITAILGEAVRSKRITENVAAVIRLPKVQEAAEFPVPTRAELEKLAGAMPADRQLAVWLMRGCGLRISEALAVSKASVGEGSLRVSEQVLTEPLRLGPLKARKSGEYRDVPLPRWVSEKIDAHLAAHGTDDEGYLFGNRSTDSFRRMFMVRAKLAGLPPEFTPHDLRHTAASIWLSRGIPITDVARWLGHRNIQITFNTYSHFLPDSFERGRDVLDDEWAVLK
jgi:integrase